MVWGVQVSTNTNTDIEIIPSSIRSCTHAAFAYQSRIFHQVLHHVYDTLERTEIRHCIIDGRNSSYNNTWDFSEFSYKKLQNVI